MAISAEPNRVSRNQSHILMLTTPLRGHINIFMQILYELRHHKNVKVSILGHQPVLADIRKLRERGDFTGLEIECESVFGDPPLYSKDPKFPYRATIHSLHMETEFQPVKERILKGGHRDIPYTSVIADMFLWWTRDMAVELGIPWYSCWAGGPWCGVNLAALQHIFDKYLSSADPSKKTARLEDVPGLEFAYTDDMPHEFVEFPDFFAGMTYHTLRATGIVFNWATELDGSANSVQNLTSILEQRKNLGSNYINIKLEDTKVIVPGPLTEVAGFGAQYSPMEDKSGVLKWLDRKAEGSVLYVAFGSIGHVAPDAVHQLALGLEASGVPFLWVLKAPPCQTINVLELLPEGFLERTRDRAFIETGWAPQTRVLTHAAVGGFLTHCGWNSVTESLCAGVPMIAWPLAAEQPLNARFLADVMRVAVRSADKPTDELYVVSEEEVCLSVKKLMVSEEGNEMRARCREVSKLAASLVRDGGSSNAIFRAFVHDLAVP